MVYSKDQKRKTSPLRIDALKTADGATNSLSVMNELEKCSHNQLAEFLMGEIKNAMKQVCRDFDSINMFFFPNHLLFVLSFRLLLRDCIFSDV